MKKNFKLIVLLCLVGTISANAAKVDTISIYSDVMKKNINCVVILPDAYAKNKKAYPVLYLLHGYGGNYATWVKSMPNVLSSTDETDMIVVCPDGAVSWYFDSPLLPESQYETHVAKEVVNHIDKNYRTIQSRTARAIAGLSMGGHGAMYLAIKHKKVYGACVALSGGVDITPFPKSWEIEAALGNYEANKKSWVQHSVQYLVHTELSDNELQIAIDCGVDDFFIGVNRILHQTLNELKISHDYIERPGKHDRDYWNNAIPYQMYYLKRFFNKKIITKK